MVVGRRAVGGRLHIVGSRLEFRPNRIERWLRADGWSTELRNVREIRIQPASSQMAPAGIRRTLLVSTTDRSAAFIVNRVEEVAERLRTAVS